MDEFVFTLTLLSALGCGLVAGFFFAFSVCVMWALGRLPPAQAIAAMQGINIVVINPLFMLAWAGTGLICLVLAGVSLFRWGEAEAPYLLIGGVVYVVGSIVVTMAFNVPRNNALAAVGAESAAGAELWAGYLSSWTAWNHVRTVASLAAAALLSIGLAQ